MSFGDYTFVRHDVDGSTADFFPEAKDREEDLMDWLLELPKEGYKASLSYSPEHSSHIFSLTGKETAGINKNRIVSFWHAEAIEAIYRGWLFHEVICAGRPWIDGDNIISARRKEIVQAFFKRENT